MNFLLIIINFLLFFFINCDGKLCLIFRSFDSFFYILLFLENDLLVVSVATKRTDGYKRYIRSLNVHGYSYEVKICFNFGKKSDCKLIYFF